MFNPAPRFGTQGDPCSGNGHKLHTPPLQTLNPTSSTLPSMPLRQEVFRGIRDNFWAVQRGNMSVFLGSLIMQIHLQRTCKMTRRRGLSIYSGRGLCLCGRLSHQRLLFSFGSHENTQGTPTGARILTYSDNPIWTRDLTSPSVSEMRS